MRKILSILVVLMLVISGTAFAKAGSGQGTQGSNGTHTSCGPHGNEHGGSPDTSGDGVPDGGWGNGDGEN